MTNAPIEPQKTRHVSRWPLLVVIVVLFIVAISGAIASNKARDENATSTTLSSTTVVGESPTSYPVATSSTITDGTAPVVTTPSAVECLPANFVAAVKKSNKVSASVANSISVKRFNCQQGYAYTELSADNADDVKAFYDLQNGSWHLLVLGTSVDPVDAGVPADIAAKLQTQ